MDGDPSTRLARQIVGVVAPDEIEVFDEVAAGIAASGRRYPRKSSDQEALNSGLPELVQVLTPVVIFVAIKIVELIIETVVKETGKQARKWWPRRRKIAAADVDALIPIGPEHRHLVHNCVVESAMEYGLTREDAEQLANKVVSVVVRGVGETEQAL